MSAPCGVSEPGASSAVSGSTSAGSTTGITAESNLAVDSVAVSADPGGQATVNVPFDVEANVTLNNLGPYGPTAATASIQLTLLPDCSTGDANPRLDRRAPI